jgi:hypothetical protein
VTVLSRCQRIRFAPPPESSEVPETLDGVERAVAAKTASAMFEAVGELAADREQAIELTLALWKRLRDALLVRESAADGRVPASRAEAAASILTALRATDEATEALRGNVAPTLVLEHLVLTLREVRA